jgi:hypothetical protein
MATSSGMKTKSIGKMEMGRNKKKAQMEIQAVAKIQYPIKSQCSKAKPGPEGL